MLLTFRALRLVLGRYRRVDVNDLGEVIGSWVCASIEAGLLGVVVFIKLLFMRCSPFRPRTELEGPQSVSPILAQRAAVLAHVEVSAQREGRWVVRLQLASHAVLVLRLGQPVVVRVE